MNILQSATRIVLILMTFALIGLTFVGKIEGKDFVVLVSMIFAFYYSKQTPPQG